MTKFPLGQIVATPDALEALERNSQWPEDFLDRHAVGDWGTVWGEDKDANEEALLTGARIMSVYKLKDGEEIWIITEAADEDGKREATTLLCPQDY